MPMTTDQLQTRRVMYDRLAFYGYLAARTAHQPTIVHWGSRANDLLRAIHLLEGAPEPEPFIIDGLIVTGDPWDDDDYWPDDDGTPPDRCEADHKDGGVCQTVLRKNGTCPNEVHHS